MLELSKIAKQIFGRSLRRTQTRTAVPSSAQNLARGNDQEFAILMLLSE